MYWVKPHTDAVIFHDLAWSVILMLSALYFKIDLKGHVVLYILFIFVMIW